MTDKPKVGFVGGGTMATAIAKGLLRAETCAPADIFMCDPDEVRQKVFADLAAQISPTTKALAQACDIIVLATKPYIVASLLPEITAAAADGLVVSIAAGVRIATIEAGLPPGSRVIRTMPNTPAQVGSGATLIAGGTHATQKDIAQVRMLFEAVGIVEEMSETLLDDATGLSGCGPAFVFVMIEALADAGVKMGLRRDQAQRLAAQTLAGAARLQQETGEHPGVLKDGVASPGGATIAGLHEIEKGGLRATLINAVEVASKRGRELG